MAGRRRVAETIPLHELLEALAARIGEEVGRTIAAELAAPPTESGAEEPAAPRVCSKPGCGKKLAAKGLCKGHYNLMLYHRRKDGSKAAPPAGRPRRKSTRS